MSLSGATKTAMDSAYAFRFINLMRKSFSDWEAFKVGIIDEKGNVLKRPKTDEEKSAYTPFHASIRSLKRTLSTVPGATAWTVLQSSLSAVGSRFGLTESDWSMIAKELDEPMFESMIAGDAGNGSGSAESIASGTTTGDVVNAGPVTIPKRKRKIVGKI